MNSIYDLDKRYGVRDVRTLTSTFLIFNRACILVHLLCLVGLCIVVANEVFNPPIRSMGNMPSTLEISIGFGTMICLFMNRPAMYFVLRILMMIEAAISVSRTRQARGWKGFFLDMFSMSLLIPPGDLLAIVLLLLLIRANSDHLDERLSVIFHRSGLGLGIGASLQYAGFVMVFAWPHFLPVSNAMSLIVLAMVAHLTLLLGVGSVEWSLRAMEKELSEIVRMRYRIEDTGESFLAALSAGSGD